MKVGALFPQEEIGSEPASVRRFAERVDASPHLSYISVFDHVLGAAPGRPERARFPYTDRHPFHEVFVVLAYMAAVTTTLEFATEVLVLPQRQTALVAKQAAELAVLAGGRLRLGVGLGWNPVEFEALGTSFADRGARLEEQVDLLRRLWSEDVVHFTGRWHMVDDAGINPRPPAPIPIWMGGRAAPALRRAARLADGWMCNQEPGPEVDAALALLREELAASERDPQGFGVAGRVSLRHGLDAAVTAAARWRELGATHLAVDSSRIGLAGGDAHAQTLESAAAMLVSGVAG